MLHWYVEIVQKFCLKNSLPLINAHLKFYNFLRGSRCFATFLWTTVCSLEKFRPGAIATFARSLIDFDFYEVYKELFIAFSLILPYFKQFYRSWLIFTNFLCKFQSFFSIWIIWMIFGIILILFWTILVKFEQNFDNFSQILNIFYDFLKLFSIFFYHF